MSLTESEAFAVDALPLTPIESGTSILLTGEDVGSLQTVFSRLIAADEDEHTVVLSTTDNGSSVKRSLNSATTGAGTRTSVLSCVGPATGEAITTVDSISDVTRLGMELSTLLATAQQETDRFRAGIFLCSAICDEVEDIRSVYRFLNTNFLTELRRGDGIGVCAIDTSAALEVDMNSLIAGLETSFNARIDVEKTGFKELQLTVSGLSDAESTIDVSL